MRGDGDPRNALHARFVGFGQGLDNRDLVPRHQAVLPGHADAAGEGLPNGGQEAEQDERHHNREQRQDCTEFLALEVAPNEVPILHQTRQAARAARWRSRSWPTPALPKASMSANCVSVKVASSPVPWSSMNSPAEVITRFRSTSAAASRSEEHTSEL